MGTRPYNITPRWQRELEEQRQCIGRQQLEIEWLKAERRAAKDDVDVLIHERERLRAALKKIQWITGGIDTPSTSNAAHYEAN